MTRKTGRDRLRAEPRALPHKEKEWAVLKMLYHEAMPIWNYANFCYKKVSIHTCFRSQNTKNSKRIQISQKQRQFLLLTLPSYPFLRHCFLYVHNTWNARADLAVENPMSSQLQALHWVGWMLTPQNSKTLTVAIVSSYLGRTSTKVRSPPFKRNFCGKESSYFWWIGFCFYKQL